MNFYAQTSILSPKLELMSHSPPFRQEKPDNPPELDINDYRSPDSFDAIIPPCEDALDGELCY